MTCFNFDGIEAIKEALLKGDKKSTENIQIKLSIIKAYTEENSKIANELNDLKDKYSLMENEISRLKDANERLEKEK